MLILLQRRIPVRSLSLTLFALISIGFLVSCNKDSEGPSKRTIAVIPKGTMHEFWKSIHAGAVKAAKECDVEIIWKGPLKEDDREDQIKVVENMIIRGVDGIVLAPLDDAALRNPVKDATRSGIPVVIFDSDLQSKYQVSFVATDNYVGGQKAGKYLAEKLGGKGKVILMRYAEGSASTEKRERGFLDAIKEHDGIELVSSNQYAGATVETAIKASKNLLVTFENSEGNLSIDGIFCPNETRTFGMLRVLQDAGWAGSVIFVGFDSTELLIQGMRKGYLHGVVVQDPINMGYLSVKTLVQHLEGRTIEKKIDTGSTLITLENMDQPEMKALLKPDFPKWLNTK
jgi:ribose transport system substrate-binding protein